MTGPVRIELKKGSKAVVSVEESVTVIAQRWVESGIPFWVKAEDEDVVATILTPDDIKQTKKEVQKEEQAIRLPQPDHPIRLADFRMSPDALQLAVAENDHTIIKSTKWTTTPQLSFRLPLGAAIKVNLPAGLDLDTAEMIGGHPGLHLVGHDGTYMLIGSTAFGKGEYHISDGKIGFTFGIEVFDQSDQSQHLVAIHEAASRLMSTLHATNLSKTKLDQAVNDLNIIKTMVRRLTS